MDYSKLIASKRKEESITIQRVKIFRETPATIYLEPSDRVSLGIGDGLLFGKTPSSLRKTDTPTTADRRYAPFSKTCVRWPLSNRQKIGFQERLSLNAGQKYC